jgi:phytoene desaturase
MRDYVFRPSHSISEFLDFRLMRESVKIQMFSSMRSHVRSLFQNNKIQQILEFPVLFLGATPANTPALYSMMNHADLRLGTWFPKGGMHQIVRAMVSVAESQGVDIKVNKEVSEILVKNGVAAGAICADGSRYEADIVIANADYHHTEQELLPAPHRDYTPDYWDKREMSPSSLLFYVGLNKRLENVQHHTLFFDEDFDRHAHDIYTQPAYPEKPLFYVSRTTQTDTSGAPEGCENLFFLIPLAPGLADDDAMRERYWNVICDRFEALTGESIRDAVVLRRSYAMRDFEQDYHSYKGNAYGLANTLFQTAFFKPRMRSKRVKNLYYTGQLTVPGPGVPPALISGQIVAREILKAKK